MELQIKLRNKNSTRLDSYNDNWFTIPLDFKAIETSLFTQEEIDAGAGISDLEIVGNITPISLTKDENLLKINSFFESLEDKIGSDLLKRMNYNDDYPEFMEDVEMLANTSGSFHVYMEYIHNLDDVFLALKETIYRDDINALIDIVEMVSKLNTKTLKDVKEINKDDVSNNELYLFDHDNNDDYIYLSFEQKLAFRKDMLDEMFLEF